MINLLALISELLESIIATSASFLRQFIVAPFLGYIRWLTAFVWTPEIVAVSIYRDVFVNHWRIFPAVIIITLAIGIPWDYFGIKEGVWFFPGIMGIWIFGIPLEEYLFFVSIAILGVLTTLIFYEMGAKKYAGKI